MKYYITVCLLLLAGCANPLTRLVPKIEMPSPPADLMHAPKPLKTIVPPAAPQAPKAEESVPPKG